MKSVLLSTAILLPFAVTAANNPTGPWFWAAYDSDKPGMERTPGVLGKFITSGMVDPTDEDSYKPPRDCVKISDTKFTKIIVDIVGDLQCNLNDQLHVFTSNDCSGPEGFPSSGAPRNLPEMQLIQDLGYGPGWKSFRKVPCTSPALGSPERPIPTAAAPRRKRGDTLEVKMRN